jgi:preprotein translocase subunit SecY
MIIAIYRIGTTIPIPNIDHNALLAMKGMTNDTQTSIFAMIAGGNTGTLFAMGIGPYITSSIIMQLLTVAIPKLEQLQKEGQEGRNKINQITRVVAVILATLQASGTVYSLATNNSVPGYNSLFIHNNWLVYIMGVVSLVSGTIFVMWLSELLTEKGFGNGSSFIIFANILSGLPASIASMYVGAQGDLWGYVRAAIALVLFIGVIAFAVLIQDGERRIPVQYSKKMVGRSMVGGQSSYMPLKVNIAGVMSIIFAVSLLQFPGVIYGFWHNDVLKQIVEFLNITNPIGTIIYVVLIFCFTFFYTSFSINPIEMAENMKKNGGFIPGIRPGKPTSDYIDRTVYRLSWIGATFYAAIAIIPVLFEWILGIKTGFGGTTLLIISSVALEIVKQLESQLLMRHYKGFLN